MVNLLRFWGISKCCSPVKGLSFRCTPASMKNCASTKCRTSETCLYISFKLLKNPSKIWITKDACISSISFQINKFDQALGKYFKKLVDLHSVSRIFGLHCQYYKHSKFYTKMNLNLKSQLYYKKVIESNSTNVFNK